MPGARTQVTEIFTALGTLGDELDRAVANRPRELVNVSGATWEAIQAAALDARYAKDVAASFDNGVAFFQATEGLRRRRPVRVEWKGPHRPPGDDVIPADIRIDHVFQVSCKYLSSILQNCGPARLFERNLVGERRAQIDWFAAVAPEPYQRFYSAVRAELPISLPAHVSELTKSDRERLKPLLKSRTLPPPSLEPWLELCSAVSKESARRWRGHLTDRRSKLRTLWRLLRIGDAPYFILGTSGEHRMRLRVASAWDWMQDYELVDLRIEPRRAGQPEVAWGAVVVDKLFRAEKRVDGHVEVRWSHGRLQGSPEAKVYLDTPHAHVPGFYPLL